MTCKFWAKIKFKLGYYCHQDRYGKCSKITNTSCLPKRPRQTAQTQI